jgi:class 3 adenylate cyclase/tetratricopeptide (TPR) repeat protein
MVSCAACGADNRAGAHFCDSCGAALAAVEAREERKTVTVLFCDVSGSTALGERLDAESFRHVLARYFDEARHVIEHHGGTVEKFIGDAVMAVFGVPRLHEDDALRAIRTARDLTTRVEALNRELERDYRTTLELRIGVSTGEVVTGTAERLATGDTVNVAARLQQAATPGAILISADTWLLVRDAVRVERIGPLDLKGKSRTVEAYRLTGVEPAVSALARRPDVPLIGRLRERKLLVDSFDAAIAKSTCVLFTVLGSAGIGKSRLAAEFLQGVDAHVVEGRCLPYGDGITYWPVVEVVRKLDRVPKAEPARAAPAIGALLGEEKLATPEEIAWAVRKLFESVAAERPLVVVFDDIHWGEAAFLDLVEHIADLSRGSAIMLLCLARPELLDQRPGWGGGKLNATTVFLEPLDRTESNELVDRLLGSEPLEPELAEKIRTTAEGNPLFLEEMLAIVRASGARDVSVPPTIRALLAARVDQLPVAERGVLERGSVEGQLFHRGAVVALGDSPEPIEPQLVALVRKELVRPHSPQIPSDDGYRFRHLLIRDAAYEALPKARRAELHERFANWLEASGRVLDERDEIMAYHLDQALHYRAELGPAHDPHDELAVRAARLFESAARRARFRGDKRTAAGLLERAANLDRPRRTRLLTEVGELLMDVGDLVRAEALLDEALHGAHAAGDERSAAIAAVMRANILEHTSSATSSEVVGLAAAAEAALTGSGDAFGLAMVLENRGRHRFFVGHAREGEQMLDRAFELAFRAGDLPRAQECLLWKWVALTFGEAPVTAQLAAFDAFPAEFDSIWTRAWMLQHRALANAYGGRFDEAREQAREAGALVNELGSLTQVGAHVIASGHVELIAGDAESAEHQLRSGYDLLGEVGETGFRSTIATLLGDALLRLRRDDEAMAVLEIADQISAPDDIDPQVRRRAVQAEVVARRGDLDQALTLAQTAADMAAATDFLTLRAESLIALANVLRARDEGDTGAAALREAAELLERREDVRAELVRDRLRSLAHSGG